jgi:hypothetical protein
MGQNCAVATSSLGAATVSLGASTSDKQAQETVKVSTTQACCREKLSTTSQTKMSSSIPDIIPIDPALTTATCASTENASFLDDGWEYEYDENEMEVSVETILPKRP